MIRLSEDKTSVLTIKTFEELEERPGFSRSLDITEKPLKEVIGVYTLPEKIPCGISSCHTGHIRGFLTVVAGGEEICVGNVCGKKHFGTDWVVAKGAFQVIANAAHYRENISTGQSLCHLWENEIIALKKPLNPNGTVYKNMRIQLSTALPEIAQKKLSRRFKSNNPIITKTRVATGDEVELENAAADSSSNRKPTNKTTYIDETVYVIRGLTAVGTHGKLRAIEIGTLLDEAKKFSQLDPEMLDHDDLKYWNRWQSQIESKINDLKLISQECRRFLDNDNLACIRKFAQIM
jgi:hypothetical protein